MGKNILKLVHIIFKGEAKWFGGGGGGGGHLSTIWYFGAIGK